MNNIIASPQLALSGQYRAEIRRNGQLIQETDWFDNLITDYGLDFLTTYTTGSEPGAIGHCKVGTGSSTPTVLQTALDAQIANKINTTSYGGSSTSIINSGAPNYLVTHTFTFTFPQGSVLGNITEVGVGPSALNEKLFSRALITDTNGDPSSLTLIAIDQLTIYYKLNIAPPLIDYVGTVNISGTTYGYKSRYPRIANSFFASTTSFCFYSGLAFSSTGGNIYSVGNFVDGDLTKRISATSDNVSVAGNNINDPYLNGTLYRKMIFRVPITAGNWPTGIKAIDFTFGPTTCEMVFDTPIIKTNTQVLSIEIQASWGRA